MATVRVIALEDCFVNATLRKAGEEFDVQAGQELGVRCYRPVAVSVAPQHEVRSEPKRRGGRRGAGSEAGQSGQGSAPAGQDQGSPVDDGTAAAGDQQAESGDDIG